MKGNWNCTYTCRNWCKLLGFSFLKQNTLSIQLFTFINIRGWNIFKCNDNLLSLPFAIQIHLYKVATTIHYSIAEQDWCSTGTQHFVHINFRKLETSRVIVSTFWKPNVYAGVKLLIMVPTFPADAVENLRIQKMYPLSNEHVCMD